MKIMRFNYILFHKCRFFYVLLLCVFITGPISAQNKPEKKAITVNVNLKVVDDKGNPIPKAKVIIGEGVSQAETDENGTYSFSAYPSDFVTISASGYDKNGSLVEDIIEQNKIVLIRSKLFMTSDDNVPLPFMSEKKRFVTGSAVVITGDQLEKYPSNDLRLAFTGLVPGLNITELDGSPGLSAQEKLGNYGITEKINVSARGRSMMYIIDDVPTDITEMNLDPLEIESVTVIKDIVGKTMFGPMAADGIILIKTKRGKTNDRVLNINVEEGVSVIDRMPGWASGSDYATLNNLARENDGIASLYNNDDITAYAKNDPYDMYHPSINFSDMMLKNTKSFTRANVSSSGGNEAVQYSAYLGYDGEGDIYKIGSKSGYNRINARSNIDLKINDVVTAQFDISAGLTNRSSPNYGYSMDMLEINSVLPDITKTPPVAFPVYANNDPSLNAPWYGVTSLYPVNPVASLTHNGYYDQTGRKGAGKIAINYNMSNIIQGLKSRTFLGFDLLNSVRIGKVQDYIAYIVTPSKSEITGNDTILLTKAHDGDDNPNLQNLDSYNYNRLTFFENLNYERIFGLHNIQSSLTYFLYRISKSGIKEPQREQLGVWTTNYTYNDKYTIQAVLNYAGTTSLSKDNRAELFPSVGAGWIISEESFMSNLKFLNYLKVHAEAGIIGYENFLEPYYNLDNYYATIGTNFGPYSIGQWFGSINETDPYVAYPTRIGNPDLLWEKSKEFSTGIDGQMFNNKVSFEINYYNNLREGQIVQLTNTMPFVAGYSTSLPWFNYNQTRYFGVESGIRYTDNAGQFVYSIGANVTIQNSKIVKYDEPAFRFDYQHAVGRSADTYWGQTYLGKFNSDEEALAVPQLYDAVLKTGDLKYKDMNGDGVVDDNDMSAIGHTTPRLFYTLNANFNYKNFELTLIGTGNALYDIPLTNSYYWNGWGDNNYSNFVKENIGGAYPRLTYYKVNNNFIPSDFWLTKGGFFKIKNIELAYTIPANKLQSIHSQGIRFFIRGANLLTFSKVKELDPESINSGVTVYPLYKTFTGGIKLTF
jgi:TonB-linked SusC/RagA family outer membrane protein